MTIDHFLKNHSSLAAAAFLFVLNVVGLSYNVAVFSTLGQNYADFANLDDFLVSALKSPIALIYTLIFLAMTGLIGRRWFRSGGSSSSFVFTVTLVIYTVAFVLGIPATFGHLAVKAAPTTPLSGLKQFVFGHGNQMELHCQMFVENERQIIVVTGRLMSEAGDMYLVEVDGKGTMVAKSCVVLIEQKM